MVNISQFIKEVKQEAAKVTWPSKQEVKMTTFMVFLMVVIVSVFLAFADHLFAKIIQMILGLRG